VDKLIIHHGDRVTEHELGEAPLTIGRDPECDLFFADRKLSRKHARVERAGPGLRLVDLESRNGTWVNEERVEACDLAPGDEIRLGGLRILIQRESHRDEGDESTVCLSGGAAAPPETGTVALSAAMVQGPSAPPPAVPRTSDDSSTVFLSPSIVPSFTELEEGDETLKRPEPEKTVAFHGQPPGKSYDTGTVVFRGRAVPLQEPATRVAARPPRDSRTARPSPPVDGVEPLEGREGEASERSLTASVTYVPEPESSGGRGWALRFAPLAAALGVFALLVVALPLLRILSAALVEESSSRGRALVDLLAAANESALAEGRFQEVGIERVRSEPGVVDAYVLGPTGDVLAPMDRAGQAPSFEGLSGEIADVRSFREGRTSNGDRVLAQPVVHRGRRVGIAVLTHRSPAAGLPWLALLFGSLLLAIAVLGVVLLARKMTVSPLNDLRLEVDALGEGGGAALPVDRAYSELSQLASSVNRALAARRAGTESTKPGVQERH
jgi:hypothetical protein